jgi:TusA-related sulfurtransferase/peroxiredoxin family protein
MQQQGLNQPRQLNCVGERCPAPILKVAKAARSLGASGGGMLEVSADDPAFPLDLKSWAISSKAEIVQMVDEHGVHRAQVRIAPRTKAGTVVSLVPNAPSAPPQAPAPAPAEVLDCRGEQCPSPILKLSKLARSLSPGARIEVLADDAAFPMDVRSWCRSAGAELVNMTTEQGVHRAEIQTAGGAPAVAQPPPAPAPAQAQVQPQAQVAVPVPVTAAPSMVVPATRVDVRGLPAEQWRAKLDQAHGFARFGDRLQVVGDVPALSQVVMQWCSDTSNSFLKFDASGPVTAEVEIVTPQTQALAPVAADNRCTMLVLHNDHEALLAALLVAVGAASQGKDVTIFFTFWGLNLLRGDGPNQAEPKQKVSLMQKMMKWMMPKGPKHQKLGQMHFGGAGKMMLGHIMRSQKLMELPALLKTAEEQGVRFIACTMSMEVMGITKRDLAPRSNLQYGGVAAFVEAAHGSGMSLVF